MIRRKRYEELGKRYVKTDSQEVFKKNTWIFLLQKGFSVETIEVIL